MFFSVYYRKMKIDFVLYEFFGAKTLEITNRIIKDTQNTTTLSYGHLLCKNKKELKIIQKILEEEYYKTKDKIILPNLLIESIKKLANSNFLE